MATATRGRTVPASKAVVTQTLSRDELMALLGQTGEVAQPGGEFHRLTLKAGVFETDDGEMFPMRKDGPALTVLIVSPPVYYNALFLGPEVDERGERTGSVDAARVGRGDLNGRFSRKYDDPNEQAKDANPANDIYDELSNLSGQRGSFKADIKVQIVPPDGQMTGEETVYTMSLSTTSVFEWRGSSKNPGGGSVSEDNFIVRLANKAMQDAVEAGADEAGQKVAVLNAMTSLRLGGVVADVYPLKAEEKGRSWWVASFFPVHIEPVENLDAPALGDGSAEEGGDVPF